MDKHFVHSAQREEYVEYMVLAQLCAIGWQRDRFIEVARAQTDAHGYDLVLGCHGITRHVQLKANKAGGRTRLQKINSALARKEGGCVLWVRVDAETLKPESWGWFGGAPGEPLPALGERIAHHAKGTAEGIKNPRPNIRELAQSRFTWLTSPEAAFDRLFG